MIVVDTNLVAYLVLPGEHTDAAEAVLRHDAEWVAPILWRSELRNILSTYVRAGHVALDDALVMAERVEVLMRGREFSVATPPVLELAKASGCSAYDCEFVALAQELGIPLVTTDQRVQAAFPATAVAPERFLG